MHTNIPCASTHLLPVLLHRGALGANVRRLQPLHAIGPCGGGGCGGGRHACRV